MSGFFVSSGSGGSGGAVSTVAGRTGDVVIAEADVTSLVADLALKSPLASPTFTGTVTLPSSTVTSAMITDAAIVNADINGSAAIALTKLAAGTNGDVLGTSSGAIANVKRPGYYKRPTSSIAETFSRSGGNGSVTLTLAGGTSHMNAIELYAGQVISSISFMSGTTAAVAPLNQWFFLTDSSRVQLATTTNDTSTAWNASTVKTLNISQIASGASSTYTITADGLYYVGVVVTVTTTVPTFSGTTDVSTANLGLAPIICGTSTASLTTPAAFPTTYSAITAAAREFYAYVS